MTEQRIYMDWNATAPLLPAARDACLSALDLAGNPSSVHGEGRKIRTLIENARRDVAVLCGAQSANVTFTSGATEAANWVLTPDFRMGKTPLKIGRLYVSAIEHPAVREGGRFAKDAVSEIPVRPSGVIDLAALEGALETHDRETGLPMVAVMLANNETGIVQPIAEVSALVKAAGGILVVDAVQAAGRLPLRVDDLGADFLDVPRQHGLDRAVGAHRHEGRRLYRAAVEMQAATPRGAGSAEEFELHAGEVVD